MTPPHPDAVEEHTMYRIYNRQGSLISGSYYATALDAVVTANGFNDRRPEEEPEPTTAEDQAALLERDGHWHAGYGLLICHDSPFEEED